MFVLPGEPPGEDPAVPRPQRDVAVVVLSAALHPALGQDVRVLRSPGQLGSLAVMDLFVELAETIKKSSLLHHTGLYITLALPVGCGLVQLPHPGRYDVAGLPGVSRQAGGVGL